MGSHSMSRRTSKSDLWIQHLLAAIIIFATMSGCSPAMRAQKTVPLPQLSPGPVELRPAYAINARLPRMSSEQLRILLAATQTAAKEHLGIELRFAPVTEIPIEDLFGRIPEVNRREASTHVYDFKSGNGNPGNLAKEFGKGLKHQGESLPEMAAYIRPYLGELKEVSYEAMGAALAGMQLAGIERWKAIPALDGGFAIDKAPYNEAQMWAALGYGDVPYELVLTNQIIASIEDIDPAIHAAIRGGYANGITTYSKQSRYGTYSVWSTFAFTSNAPWITRVRDGEEYTPEEAARLAGIGATHELGHQLLHLLHPFGNKACIMNPVPMFTYRAWINSLSPRDCPIGSSPAMQPGAYTFEY